jgi:hypothetical protein
MQSDPHPDRDAKPRHGGSRCQSGIKSGYEQDAPLSVSSNDVLGISFLLAPDQIDPNGWYW